MILIEDLGGVLPTARSGKIVGIVHNKDEWLVACEYGLFRIWDDGFELKAYKTEGPPQPDAEVRFSRRHWPWWQKVRLAVCLALRLPFNYTDRGSK